MKPPLLEAQEKLELKDEAPAKTEMKIDKEEEDSQTSGDVPTRTLALKRGGL
ncbi:hypothetical protein SDJN02_23282, partial [Cucurbita argyrosperma subsp. argyrosperma]